MIPVKPRVSRGWSDFVQPAEQNCTERMIPVKPSAFVQPAEQNCTEVDRRKIPRQTACQPGLE